MSINFVVVIDFDGGGRRGDYFWGGGRGVPIQTKSLKSLSEIPSKTALTDDLLILYINFIKYYILEKDLKTYKYELAKHLRKNLF